MHYKCKNCKYEFDVFTTPHPHTGKLGFSISGCPICAKAAVMKKVCPKCSSTDLEQSIIQFNDFK